jgi:hypothetical protein
MNIKIIASLMITTIFITGCPKKYGNIVFFEDYPHSQAWIGERKINIEAMKIEERNKYVRFSYDPVTSRIFAWNLDKNFNYTYLADVTSGYYEDDKEISFDVYMKLDTQFVFLYNDKSLIQYRWGLYGIADLKTGNQYIIDITEEVDAYAAMGTIGYDGRLILFVNGYYDIFEKKYYPYFIKLDFPRAIPNENIIIGYDEGGFITMYNYITQDIKVSKISRYKFNSNLEYAASDLLFLSGSNLYYANDNIGIKNILEFIRSPASRKWYRYNFEDGVREKIFTPSAYVKIIGEIIVPE